MHVWMLLKSELRRSLGVLGCMALVLALALSLAVSTGLAEKVLRSSLAQTADDFDLLVGARGGAVSLLLGTVYLRDEPLSLVPAEALRTLKDSKRVRSATASEMRRSSARQRAWCSMAGREMWPRAAYLKPLWKQWQALKAASGLGMSSFRCTAESTAPGTRIRGRNSSWSA